MARDGDEDKDHEADEANWVCLVRSRHATSGNVIKPGADLTEADSRLDRLWIH